MTYTDLEKLKVLFEEGDSWRVEKYYVQNLDLANPEYYAWLEKKKEGNSDYDMLIDNAFYSYHYERGEFEKAYQIGKKYDFEKNWKFEKDYSNLNDPFAGFEWKVPYIFYATGRLEEFISFYASINEDSRLKTLERTHDRSSMEFWLAAAYSQRGEYDAALEYFDKALEKCAVWGKELKQMMDTNGSGGYFYKGYLMAIVWQSYMSDALDGFRNAGRFDEIEMRLRKALDENKQYL